MSTEPARSLLCCDWNQQAVGKPTTLSLGFPAACCPRSIGLDHLCKQKAANFRKLALVSGNFAVEPRSYPNGFRLFPAKLFPTANPVVARRWRTRTSFRCGARRRRWCARGKMRPQSWILPSEAIVIWSEAICINIIHEPIGNMSTVTIWISWCWSIVMEWSYLDHLWKDINRNHHCVFLIS